MHAVCESSFELRAPREESQIREVFGTGKDGKVKCETCRFVRFCLRSSRC